MLGFKNPFATASRLSLRRMRIMGVALALAAFAIASTAGPAFAWDAGAYSPADEQLLFSLTNQDRASAGLNALANDTYLHKEAEWRAKDMADRDYFSHQIPPNNSMVFAYMQQDGYCFKVAGENIGLSTWGADVATNRIEVAFMGSTSHRANILGSWARMGVGAYQAPDGRKLYAVLFSIPCGVVVPTPTPVATPVPPVATPVPPVADPTEVPVATPVPPVADPTPTPVAAPVTTRKPAPKPVQTARPIAQPTSSPTPAPTDTPASTPSAAPTATTATTATIAPVVTTAPSANPTASPATSTGPQPATITSLRVREKPASQGPLDSLFHSLFGGLLGW